jgi:lysophospholipase L1-like esterase
MSESTELRMTRMIFVGSFLIATVSLAVLALTQPLRSNIVAGYLWGVFLVVGTIVIGSLSGRRRVFLRVFLLVSVLNLVLVPAEAYLRMRGFRYESGIQFGYPRPYQFSAFERDESLFWRFPPGEPGINAYGFRGPEVEKPKPNGVFRILFIGNSCTYQGFPRIVGLILREYHPALECLNFATPGYTSYQGRVLLELYMDVLEPDLVVASFGWNDRWLAYGEVDSEKRVQAAVSPLAGVLQGVYSKWRLLQFSRKALSPIVGRIEPLEIPRVPEDEFRRNLEAIGAMCDERSIPVVFGTEPSSHAALGVPPFIVESGYAVSSEQHLRLLDEYNDVVREVARSRHLVDLDSHISGRNDVREIFTGDGLHFSEAGLALVAKIEAEYILENFTLRSARE